MYTECEGTFKKRIETMCKLLIYISLIFFCSRGVIMSQNEPSSILNSFVVSILKNDSVRTKELIVEDYLYKNFYIEYNIKPTDSIKETSILFYYRLSFYGTWDILFVSKDQIAAQRIFIERSEFKVLSYTDTFLIADYNFSLLSNNKVKLRCKMSYINDKWKITSIRNQKLKLK